MPLPNWYILSTLIPWYIRVASNGLEAASIILWPTDTSFKQLHPLVYMGGGRCPIFYAFPTCLSCCKHYHTFHTQNLCPGVFVCAYSAPFSSQFCHICHTSHMYETLKCGSLAWTRYKIFFRIQDSLTRFSCGTVWSVCWKHFFHWNFFRTLDMLYLLCWCS